MDEIPGDLIINWFNYVCISQWTMEEEEGTRCIAVDGKDDKWQIMYTTVLACSMTGDFLFPQ